VQLVCSCKVRGKVVALIIKHYGMKTWGNGGIPPPFLALQPDGGDWSVSHMNSFAAAGEWTLEPMRTTEGR
jgi:hypothetical protein